MFLSAVVMMETKSKEITGSVLTKLCTVSPGLSTNIKLVITDPEEDTIDVLRAMIPNVKVITSWYHYKQVNINLYIKVVH